MKTFYIFITLITISFANDQMTIEINNPIIDSIEQEITILKKEMIKDQVFYHCKKTFFDNNITDQCNFILSLKDYKNENFIIETFQKFLKIKEMEKQKIQIIIDNMEMCNEKGILRLHVKLKRNEIKTINTHIYNLTISEDIE